MPMKELRFMLLKWKQRWDEWVRQEIVDEDPYDVDSLFPNWPASPSEPIIKSTNEPTDAAPMADDSPQDDRPSA